MAWQQIDGDIWGIDKVGDPANLLKPGDPNVIKAGWPAGKPNRQYFNWILEECHNNIGFFETNGWPLWDATTEYDQYALIRFGTKHYVSLQTANLNKNPGTETAWWKDYFVWLSEQAGTEQTNQTVANFNDGYFYPHPEYVTGTTVNLTNTNILLTDLALYPLSATPLTITVPTTVANTWYYVYVDIPAGASVVAGDVSITTATPTFDHSKGMFVSGTKRCIGYIEGNNTGNGEAEPYVITGGWYQRQNKKRRLALYTPAPQTNTTLYCGVPNFDGNGMAEITTAHYEEGQVAMGYADHTSYTGSLNASDLTDYLEPGYDLLMNGSNTAASGVNVVTVNDVFTAGVSNVATDSSGNILIASHSGGQDEMMAVWLKRFRLPRGIYSI